MAYVRGIKNYSNVNFLASSSVESFTTIVSDTGVAVVDGKKIVKAGTVLPTNDASAKGILYNDVDVTYGPQPGALIEEGYILEARLPVVPSALAKTALKKITFK
ncbi:hypothetical protein [Paenibacillus macquariensis]|uniref:Uncharacterized protein n=1 Tax=Paenibacillus macquariensis TaxID=948756 RepID=A0ABY1JXC4_9BACL|nr:hypothetical protein [Paenibacillus macquariensis]MEC0089339.1 hypothetical protein [Paenibacillus macquariensis]OAB33259.1 hypothetical protein PMSM_14700 [Paenibacillus macquariensis subsp. macquariensis]SIQ93471.1 hypothetical protein SAMN05421578_105119 [Paenibacillus macquariensis]